MKEINIKDINLEIEVIQNGHKRADYFYINC